MRGVYVCRCVLMVLFAFGLSWYSFPLFHSERIELHQQTSRWKSFSGVAFFVFPSSFFSFLWNNYFPVSSVGWNGRPTGEDSGRNQNLPNLLVPMVCHWSWDSVLRAKENNRRKNKYSPLIEGEIRVDFCSVRGCGWHF